MRRAIARKRDGEELSEADWSGFVAGFLATRIDEAQAAALLMAAVIRGLSAAETAALTVAFVASGETLVAPDPRTIDKHSSGGVADGASLVVVPLVAACGVPVAKLSGRALGHTGGTLEKLEAIPGVRTDLSPERFFGIVGEVGCAIAGQSARLVPADERLYALRDRTATVPSAGLIAASIVSKKVAGGAAGIVYDVKTGRGALLAQPAESIALARTLVELTASFGRRARALVTDMNEPLGRAIGTGLEAIEARDVLRDARSDGRLWAVVLRLGRAALALAEPERGDDDARDARLERALRSGAAYEHFERMLAAQGAEPGALGRLAPHAERRAVLATRSGRIAGIDAVALGEATRDLVAAAGSGAGIVVERGVGDEVRAGEPVARTYGASADAARELAGAFEIADAALEARPLVYEEIVSRAERAPSTLATK